VLAVVLAIASCGGKATQSCGDNPLGCAAGETCWPTGGDAFGCLPAKDYKPKGSECEVLVARTTCAAGLLCVDGVCLAWCDPGRGRGCEPGERCEKAPLSPRRVSVADGGADGGAGVVVTDDGVKATVCVRDFGDGGIPDLRPPPDIATAPRDLTVRDLTARDLATGDARDLGGVPDGGVRDATAIDATAIDATVIDAAPIDAAIDAAEDLAIPDAVSD
jgi:hypothetical protein